MRTAFFLILFGWSGHTNGGVAIPLPYPTLEDCQQAAKQARTAAPVVGADKLTSSIWTFCVPAPKVIERDAEHR